MTTYPLPTLRPTITAAGISAPTYADILASLQASMRAIFGNDVYLEPDSQDGQMLAIFALAIHDGNQRLIAVYNGYSPTFAQGASLSSLVKINGIARLVSSRSQANLRVVGEVGTTITQGIAQDANGTLWDLPASVVIPLAGEIVVTALCEKPGNIVALANAINKIYTPTRGWQTVNNDADAVPGAPIESDAKLRLRQSVSTALPALSSLEGIVAAVAQVTGVQRFAAYENSTSVTDLDGIPGHSIAIVVEGGDAQAIAQVIADKKSPGTGTFGTTTELIVDQFGVPVSINFFALTEVPITVGVGIRALPGYVSSTGGRIIASLAQFISTLAIGELCYVGRLWGPANLSGDAAAAATGLSQGELDQLARTFTVGSIAISRAVNIPDTLVTLGPYAAGVTVIHVASLEDFYLGAPVRVKLDNAANLDTTITAIGSTLTLANAVPAGRQILTGAQVFLLADVAIAFNEGAACTAANVTLTVT